ncbi:DnaT-like ssDNA-binding protein [Pseudomonas canadensis]|uniref:DnaT-like ssDNA-binding protein n=1 Tax=Pseudomonas canadensis TaxID=915099 RepID=A0ABZ1A3M8_9PSED|nr:DnaT-like ssDNA-binding protein [Pseudomonas canadensis]WRI22598.1 DnaT-like ssDNA-binding protein [Pseudomonas canadensis]
MTLIIEDGTGKPDAESYASSDELAMYAVKFGTVIPEGVPAQEALLRRAALAMDGMTWKGRKTSSEQGLSWPRREVLLDQEIKPNNYLPARIQYGQMALAAEIHQDDIDPVEKRKGAVLLDRVEGAVTRQYAAIPSTSNRLLPAAPDRPSATQFADYLKKRGLFAVRA